MRRTFEGRTVLVTGAAGGLGYALVDRFLAAGARVGALDLDAEALDAAKDDWTRASHDPSRVATEVATAVADCADEDATRAAVAQIEERLGPVHTVVANAGITHIEPFAADQAAHVRRVMEVNFLGAVHVTAACFDQVTSQSGLFVAISSVAGFAPLLHRTGYCASKHALHGFYDTLRLEVRATGAEVLLVCPSFIATGIRKTLDPGGATPIVGSEATPEAVAGEIVLAAESGRRLLTVGRVGKVSYQLRRFAPWFYEWLMLRRVG